MNRNDDINNKDILLLDLRDYNEAAKMPVNGAYNLPLAYLKRHYGTIQHKDIVIMAPDLVSKNMGARFLKRKGFNILGYSLTECHSTHHVKKCCVKGGTLHEI
jgi:rhodanese-related sulfurtransferase